MLLSKFAFLFVLLSFSVCSYVKADDEAEEASEDTESESTPVRSRPVVIRLPKTQGVPSSLQRVRSSARGRVIDDSNDENGEGLKTEAPETPDEEIPSATVAPPTTRLPFSGSVVRQQSFQSIVPPGQSPLVGSSNGSPSLSSLLANNPSLLSLLQGIGGKSGALSGFAGAPPGFASGFGGSSGLLAPSQGSFPSLGLGQPPAFPGLPGFPGPPGVAGSNGGLLNVISSLGRQLGGAVGLGNIVPGAASTSAVGPSIPRIPGIRGGPPIAGIPNIPGLPVFPGAITPGGQLDVLQLVSAISRRAFNGTSITEVLPPTQIQKLADNLTDTLLPDTPIVDLGKYMGRWFEGINSPRASDQRCVVHHYGGLTENGKTATFTALKIYRENSEFGQVRYSIGYSFRGGRQEGMLQMHTSESSDPIPYWIYKVGPTGKDAFGNEQYEYAVVSNWIRYPLIVLVRDPDQFKRVHEESVLKWLEEKGFINGFVRAFNLVQPVSYANCQYADSTFELFG